MEGKDFCNFVVGEKYFGKYVGAVAVILFSFSYKYHVFISLLQYGVLLGFLLLLYIFFQVELKPFKRRYIWFTLLFLGGVESTLK